MFFDQKIHPLNFDIPEHFTVDADAVELSGPGVQLRVRCAEIIKGCLRLRFENAQVSDGRQLSDAVLPEYRSGRPAAPREDGDVAVFATAEARVELSAASLQLDLAGFSLRTAATGIGGCGEALLLNFDLSAVDGCYGFGERTKHLNKLGDSVECLTIDVVAIFRHTYARDDFDPTYVAIPLAILKSGERFLGLFFDNPSHAIMDAGQSQPGEFWYQSLSGNTDLYLLAGPSLA
ncbi:MAG: hypothetical protein IAF00_08290, partial [Phycisphaerales bacterium]|nr:hypothetical protein [Phycisphaerales bacterium]